MLGELAVVAGEDQLGAGLARFRQQLAGDARIQHRRLVHDDDGAPVPRRAPALQREQRRVHRAGLGEAVLGEVLRHRVGRRQADHPPPVARVRVADRREGKTLAGAGAALDQRQAGPGHGMIECRLLIRPQRPPHQRQPRRRL